MKKKSSKTSKPMVPRLIRMDADLVKSVNAYQTELRDKFGIKTGFSSTVRTLVRQGLKASQELDKR